MALFSTETDEEENEVLLIAPPSESRLDEEPIYFRDGRKRIDFVLVYDKKEEEYETFRATFEKNLTEQGLELEHETLAGGNNAGEEDKKGEIAFVKVHATWDVLCKWAERMRMPKPIAPNNLCSNSTDMDWSAPCSSFWKKLTAVPKPQKYGYIYSDRENDPSYFTAPFDMARIEKFMIKDQESFFLTGERQRIVLNILNRTKYGESGLEVGMNRLLGKGCYTDYFPLHEGDWKPRHLQKSVVKSGIQLNKRQTLYWLWARPGMWYSTQPFELIRQYFGEKVGMYFAWLGYYTTMLIPVGIIGVLGLIYGIVLASDDIISEEVCTSDITMCPRCHGNACAFWKLSDSCLYTRITRVFDNEFTFVFAFIMSLWATFFLEFWKRKRAHLVYEWDLENFAEEKDQIRPEYEGLCKQKRINPVTDKPEPYLPTYKRVPRLLASCSALFVMVVVVLGAVFGVAVYKIIVAVLLPKEASGVIKQHASLITTFSATCINFIVITILNTLYTKVAGKLTDMEAPRTTIDYEESFTLKMFLFQAVNYYSSIFYIAFFKGKFVGSPYQYNRMFGIRVEECDPSGCLTELCIQLGVIMTLKQAWNNIQELLTPILKNWWNKISFFKAQKEEKSEVDLYEDQHENVLYADYLLEDPGRRCLFTEYLEMVIQFGFVTLFVAAFPLAPLFALINNVVEIRLDAYKFTTQNRRLPARRDDDIGIWFPILKSISTFAVITNGLVIALTSEFIPRLIYRFVYSPCANMQNVSDVNCMAGYVNATLMYIPVGDIDREPPYNTSAPGVPDICWFRASDPVLPVQPIISFWHVFAGKLALLVVFEHAVFGLKLLIDLIIPDVPKELDQQIERQIYLEMNLLYTRDDEDEKVAERSVRHSPSAELGTSNGAAVP